jgi:hypothetical protein
LVSTQAVSQALAVAVPEGRAINNSYFFDHFTYAADGNSLLSKGLDWITRRYAVLNVVSAGNRDSQENVDEWGPPADAYNALVVGATEALALGYHVTVM